MILPPSTLETMHAITGEEAMPKGAVLRRLVSLIYAVDWSVWTKPVDLCVVGGDPLTVWARLRAECRRAPLERAKSIAVLIPSQYSGAPLAALEDEAILRAFVEEGLVPSSLVDWALAPSARVRHLLEGLADDLAVELARSQVTGILSADLAQGGRDKTREEILLRLTRPEGVKRPQGARRCIAGRAGAQQIAGSEDATSGIFSRSRAYFHSGWARLRERALVEFEAAPGGTRFADILITKQCDVLSGFISPGTSHIRADPSVEFMQDALGANVFSLAYAKARTLEGAMDAWRSDLRRALS